MNATQIVIIAISFIVVVLAILIFTGVLGPGGQDLGQNSDTIGELKIWGTERLEPFATAFGDYEREKKIKITYIQKEQKNFTQDLITAIARREGPDLVIENADWIGRNHSILSPAPGILVSARDYRNAFVDVAASAFLERDTVWALPLWTDPLVLFWNKDLFNLNSLAEPPGDWTEFLKASNKIKKIRPGGVIERPGAALGRADTIPRFKDILSLVLLQLGGDIEKSDGAFIFGNDQSDTDVGASALRFYTDFGKSSDITSAYTWNNSLADPKDLFLRGNLGMMIDYISYMPVLQAKNPHLSFDIAPTPQKENAEFPIYFADVEGIAVLLGSQNVVAAWNFAKWFIGPDSVRSVLPNRAVAPARRGFLKEAENQDQLFPLIQKVVLNARRTRDAHPAENEKAIASFVEAVADSKLGPEEAISQERTRLNRER